MTRFSKTGGWRWIFLFSSLFSCFCGSVFPFASDSTWSSSEESKTLFEIAWPCWIRCRRTSRVQKGRKKQKNKKSMIIRPFPKIVYCCALRIQGSKNDWKFDRHFLKLLDQVDSTTTTRFRKSCTSRQKEQKKGMGLKSVHAFFSEKSKNGPLAPHTETTIILKSSWMS